MNRSFFFRGLIFSALGVSALVACSLGLDASKLDAIPPGGLDAGVDAEPAPDTGTVKPGETACTDNAQCPPKGCFAGRCEPGPSGKVCVYDLCPTTEQCAHRQCINSACLDSVTPHRFIASRMTLGAGGLGCKGDLNACVGLVYPFAFVSHETDGLRAYPIVDFTPDVDGGEGRPPGLVVDGAAFTVVRVVASGRYAWFIGLASSSNTVDVAHVAVPNDPNQAKLVGKRYSIQLDPGAELAEAFAGADGAMILFLKGVTVGKRFATVLKPDAVPAKPTFSQVGLTDSTAQPVTSTGDRVVEARYQADAGFFIDLVRGAGEPTAVRLPEKDLAQVMGLIYPEVQFTSTPGGRVISVAPSAVVPDGGGFAYDGVQVSWILENATDTAFFGKPNVPVKNVTDGGPLPPAPPPGLVGPIAALGENQLMMLTAEDAGTLLRVVSQTGLEPASEERIGISQNQLVVRGAVSSNGKGRGYVFTRPAGTSDGVHVAVLDVGCNK